jgi:hypothetical protein
MNHSQKECHKNIRDNKACVDNKGNKFWLKLNMASKNPIQSQSQNKSNDNGSVAFHYRAQDFKTSSVSWMFKVMN